jgi:transcriptional regulator with XRE-family HTH domain
LTARSANQGRADLAPAHEDDPAANGQATVRTRRRISKPDDLAGAIKRVMLARGLSTREVVRKVPKRHVGTVYRLLAGRTTDPWASTVVSLCSALGADPDELLEVSDPIENLEPELRQLLQDLAQLSEQDRWLVLDMLRAALARLAKSQTP